MIYQNDIITSRNNPTVKWAASLKDKKGREAAESFIAEGEKLTYEAIKAGLPVTHIFVTEGKKEKILPRLRDIEKSGLGKDASVFVLPDSVFEKISTENAPQGVISVIKHLDFFRKLDIIYKEEFLKNTSERLIILSSLRDPANLGSVIRSAVAFGVEHIILSSDSADIYNPKAVRAAMGSMYRVRLTYVSDLPSCISNIRASGRRVMSAELSDTAETLSNIDICKSDVFVIGNEGHGVSKEVSERCDTSVYIPISSATESLNASVAAGIFMWEQSKK